MAESIFYKLENKSPEWVEWFEIEKFDNGIMAVCERLDKMPNGSRLKLVKAPRLKDWFNYILSVGEEKYLERKSKAKKRRGN